MCTAIFNVNRVTFIAGHLQKMTKENIVKHGFEYTKTCPRLKIVIKALLLWLGNMTRSYMQYIKSLSAILYKK